MSHIDDEDLKLRAYALWEAEGRPDGKHDEHWEQARSQMIDGTQSQSSHEAVGTVSDTGPSGPAEASERAAATGSPLSVVDDASVSVLGESGDPEPVVKRRGKSA